MNHGCEPSCSAQKWDVGGETVIGIYADVDITKGTELTFDYNLKDFPLTREDCRCGAPGCGHGDRTEVKLGAS